MLETFITHFFLEPSKHFSTVSNSVEIKLFELLRFGNLSRTNLFALLRRSSGLDPADFIICAATKELYFL
jgi:hypothetical protein